MIACPAAGGSALDGGDERAVSGEHGTVGPDDLFRGPGFDVVEYDPSDVPSAGVTVTLRGVPNDGHPDENDNVHSDVEGVHGTHYDDVLTGNNSLDGGGDVLFGEAVDEILWGFPTDVDRLYCGLGYERTQRDGKDVVLTIERLVAEGRVRPRRHHPSAACPHEWLATEW